MPAGPSSPWACSRSWWSWYCAVRGRNKCTGSSYGHPPSRSCDRLLRGPEQHRRRSEHARRDSPRARRGAEVGSPAKPGVARCVSMQPTASSTCVRSRCGRLPPICRSPTPKKSCSRSSVRTARSPRASSLAYVPVFRPNDCGMGSADAFAVVWIGACEQGPTINSLWGGGSTVTAAHELVHAMGAVPRCVPHVRAGHATDSVNDLMFAGAEARPGHRSPARRRARRLLRRAPLRLCRYRRPSGVDRARLTVRPGVAGTRTLCARRPFGE